MQDTNPDLPSFTFLVAFEVKGKDRRLAELALHGKLVPILESKDPSSPVESWWVAEDDRQDGSDNGSAIFVPVGQQELSSRLLLASLPAPGAEAAEEAWVVETTYNTDPEGKPVPEGDWSNRTLHGPFPSQAVAEHFMNEVWPDGDTDVREQIAFQLNDPAGLFAPLTGPTCEHCGAELHQQMEQALSGELALVWADPKGTWVCPSTGDEHSLGGLS